MWIRIYHDYMYDAPRLHLFDVDYNFLYSSCQHLFAFSSRLQLLGSIIAPCMMYHDYIYLIRTTIISIHHDFLCHGVATMSRLL